jgi:Fic family protein
LIPETAEKPKRKTREETEVVRPAFARKLGNQQKKRNYHGMYDYTILNLTYSSRRMASCRLTRTQIESIIKNGKAQPSFEPMKISDLIEARNHVVCVDLILKAPMEPLTTKYIKDLHRKLFTGTVDEQLERVVSGVYRRPSIKTKNRELPLAMEVPDMMKQLIKIYENKENVGLLDLLEFHVQFEKIAPFDDGNGRVGRLILFKECLRHDVMPFIIDDKRRGRYLEGLRDWDKTKDTLLEVVLEAQQRYGAQVELQKLLAANREFLPENYRDEGK